MNRATLIRRNLTRRKLGTMLVLLSIAVAFLLFGLLNAFRVAATSEGSAADSRRLLVSNAVSFTQPLPIGYLPRIAALPGTGTVSHRTWFGGYFREPNNFIVTYAVDPATFFDVYPNTGADPAAIARFRGRRDALLLGTAVAARFGLKVGDRVPLSSNVYARADGAKSWDFELVGLLPSAESQFQNTALIHYAYLDTSRAFNQGKVSQFLVTTEAGADPAAVIAANDRQFANSLTETATMTESQFNRAFAAQFADLSTIVALVTGAGFAAILMIAGSAMARAVRERRAEIATLAAIGFSRIDIARQLLGEAFLLASLGGGAGMLLAAGALGAIKASAGGQLDHIALAPSIWAAAALAVLLFALAVAAAPLALIARMDIPANLKRS